MSPSICLYDDEFAPSIGYIVLAAELACIGIVGFGGDSLSTVRARVQSLECRLRKISRRLRRLIPQSSGDTHTPMVSRGHIDKIPVERQWARALIYTGTISVERSPACSYDKGMRMCVCVSALWDLLIPQMYRCTTTVEKSSVTIYVRLAREVLVCVNVLVSILRMVN